MLIQVEMQVKLSLVILQLFLAAYFILTLLVTSNSFYRLVWILLVSFEMFNKMSLTMILLLDLASTFLLISLALLSWPRIRLPFLEQGKLLTTSKHLVALTAAVAVPGHVIELRVQALRGCLLRAAIASSLQRLITRRICLGL